MREFDRRRTRIDLRWEFEDANRFHRSSNVDKMHSGIR